MQIGSVLNKSFEFLLKQERAFKVNLAKNVTQNFFLATTTQYQSIFIFALGANATQLGFGNAVGGIASVAAALFVGWLSSRYHIKSIFMIGIAMIAAASFFFLTAVDWWMVIPALIIMTFALRVTSTMCPTICGSCFKSNERASGMALCDTLSSLPRLAAPVLAAILVTIFGGLNSQGIRPLYAIQFAGLCLSFIMVWRLFEDPHEIALVRTKQAGDLSFSQNVGRLLKEVKHAKKWIGYMSITGMPIYLSQIYWTLFADKVKGADQYVIGQMTTAMWIIPIVLSFPIGKLADIVGRKRTIYLITPFLLVSMLMLIYARNPAELIISGFLQGTIVLISVLVTAMTTEMVTPQLLGIWLSILSMFEGFVGLVMAPAIAGLMWDLFSPVYVIVLMIAATIASALLLVSLPETLKRKVDTMPTGSC